MSEFTSRWSRDTGRRRFEALQSRMTNMTEWERQRHSVVLACVVTLLGHFTWTKKFVFFFAWKDRSPFCFRNVTMADIWIEVTWQSWQHMEFIFDNVTILEGWNVASSQLTILLSMLVDGRPTVHSTAEVQVCDPCTLTYNTLRFIA